MMTETQEEPKGWALAIAEAKAQIKQLKQSIRTFEDLRDQGMEFPEPKAEFESQDVQQLRRKDIQGDDSPTYVGGE